LIYIVLMPPILIGLGVDGIVGREGMPPIGALLLVPGVLLGVAEVLYLMRPVEAHERPWWLGRGMAPTTRYFGLRRPKQDDG
jgi:hypothetical protein